MPENQVVEDVKQAPLQDKKVLVEEALKVATQYGDGEELVRHLVHGASQDDKHAAITEAIQSAGGYRGARDLVSVAVNAAPIDAAKDAIAKAAKSASEEDAQELVTQVINAVPTSTAKAAVEEAKISPETLDQIWLWIVKTFSFVLGGAAIGLIAIIVLDVFYKVDTAEVQMMLTVFTTVAGILAGFITGQAVGTAKERKREQG